MDSIVSTIIGMVIIGSLATWGSALTSLANRRNWIARDVPATRPRPFFAVAITLAWILYSCVSQIFQSLAEPAPLDFTHGQAIQILIANIAMQVTVTCLILISLTKLGEHRITRYGIDGRHPIQEIGFGALGYLLAAIPVYALSAAMFPFRTEGNEHPFLQILQDQQSWQLVTLMIVTAVVMAPIQEELIFRVILQGSLQRTSTPLTSILISATLFAVVHGFPDAVGLFPLALVLGYFYWRTGSFLTVVTIHAIFNGVSILLTLLCPDC